MKYFLTKTQLLMLAMLLVSSAVFAQFTVTGTVTDSEGESLIGVSIVVKGTATGTVTDIDGSYSIKVPDGGTILVYSYTGYASLELAVSPSSSKVDVQLKEAATLLEQVVVTGLASSMKRKNLANAVSTVSAKELTGVTSVQTLDGALQGKLTGANIVSNSGAPGGGISVKLRGITTITGSSEPLYIVDGVYMDNSAFSAGTNPITLARTNGEVTDEQDNPSNRIADLNPDDIEFIEILKGASAAAIYGARANAGVVVIRTKRGKEGKTKVDFNQSFGAAKLIRTLGMRDYTAERVEASFGIAERDKFVAAQNAGTLNDYEDVMYGNSGFLYNGHLSASGGNDKTKFYISGGWKDEAGIIETTGYERRSLRANVDHKLSDFIDFSLSTNFINASADRGLTNNDNAGVSFGIALTSTPPWADLFPDENGNYPNNPYAASNPLQTRDLMTNNETTNRFLGGLTMNVNLIRKDNSFLKLRLRGGMDYFTNETKAYFPENLQFQAGNQNGFFSRGNNVVQNYNTSAFLVFDNSLDNNIQLNTSVGISRLDFSQERLTTQATQLIGAQTNLQQAGAIAVFHKRLEQEDIGYSAQQVVNWDDKIIGTLGVRVDQASLNGDPNKLFAYPKASVAFNLAGFDFMSSSENVDLLKVRVAYGEAGGVPSANANDLALPSQTVFAGANIEGSAGSLVGSTRGNPDIRPERSKELEAGVDIGLFGNKLLFEGTYYNKTVADLILRAEVATSQGFTFQTLNAGELVNKGVELTLTANPVKTATIDWSTRVGWWKNNSEMTRLDIPAFTTGSFASALGIFKVEEGKSVTQIVGPIPGSEGDVVLGNAEPDFQLSWYNDLTLFNDFEFYMLWHWKSGGDNIQLSSLLTDFGQTSYDYDDDDDGDGVVNGDQRIAALVGDTPDASQFVEDGSYIKLREIGVFYNLPQASIKNTFGGVLESVKIGFSGNNLVLISDYKGYDPEVSNFGNNGVSSGVEVTPFPTSKRFFFHLNVGF